MRTKLAGLLAGIVLLGLAGAAQAEANTSGITLPALTDTWSLPSTDTQPASTESQVVTLTDSQLDEATAGVWYRYYGWFGFYYGSRFFLYYGYHYHWLDRFGRRPWYNP